MRLEHVSKSFGSRKVLDDISFEVPRGQAFVILGRSGTGKSVTLRHIVALVRPDAGRVFVDEAEVSVLNGVELARVRRGIGFLFQNGALFDSITVGENVAFPLRRHTRLADADIRERARGKLRAVGLEREYDKMPAALSGGMKKRAALARAMVLDPPLLLVDEPSAGLDLKEQAGTTLVIVTHNIPSARRLGDMFAMLHHGRIIEQGSADALARSGNPLVRAFLTSQNAG